MKTTIIYKPGAWQNPEETYDEVLPSFDPEEKIVSLIDKDCVNIGDSIPLNIVQEIRWVNEESL